jgi:three-Cys-motif partner protein
MTPKGPRSSGTGAPQFGGGWTDEKLQILAGYLRSYTSALKNAPFSTVYVDAFAGSGYRELRTAAATGNEAASNLLFPDIADPEPQGLLRGSAKLALDTEPRFGEYVFIEKNAERCTQLEELRSAHPALASSIRVLQGEANEELVSLCRERDWRSQRAVLFLDPFGTEVRWETIEVVAATKAIDMWVLFPVGMGVNRLLKRSGEVPPSWRARLDDLLGTKKWYDEFYKVERVPTLFGQDEEHVVKATTETIGAYFNERLKGIFDGVAANPRILRNSRNSPLYLLCFAAGNAKGAPIALRIAEHLLKMGSA